MGRKKQTNIELEENNTVIEEHKEFNIVVPLYKEELDEADKLSISRLFNITENKYPVYFICDINYNADNIKDFLLKECDLSFEKYDYYIKRIKGNYFESKYTYSKMLLSDWFYKEWLALGFDYTYIYQTDCYLFRDELQHFVDLGYDYIGAPILATNSDWGTTGGYVGNGGFSLRNNRKFMDVLWRDSYLWQTHGEEFNTKELLKNKPYKYIDFEDIFICKLLSKYVKISIPSCIVAAHFAYDRNPFECSIFYNVNIPMCAHNFVLQEQYWKKYIPELTKNEELVKICKKVNEDWENTNHKELEGEQGCNLCL